MLGRRRGGGKLSELTVHPEKIVSGGENSSVAASDGPILEICPRLQGHLPNFSAIQTHPSRRFHLAVDSPGLRRSGFRPQIINHAQYFPIQFPQDQHLGYLERDIFGVIEREEGPSLATFAGNGQPSNRSAMRSRTGPSGD